MQCEKCGWHDWKTVNTRVPGKHVRRRRECLRCKHRWTTLELPLAEYGAMKRRIRELMAKRG